MTPQEQFVSLYKQMADLCKENGWGDPFSYARSKEIYATCVLGHTTITGIKCLRWCRRHQRKK